MLLDYIDYRIFLNVYVNCIISRERLIFEPVFELRAKDRSRDLRCFYGWLVPVNNRLLQLSNQCTLYLKKSFFPIEIWFFVYGIPLNPEDVRSLSSSPARVPWTNKVVLEPLRRGTTEVNWHPTVRAESNSQCETGSRISGHSARQQELFFICWLLDSYCKSSKQ